MANGDAQARTHIIFDEPHLYFDLTTDLESWMQSTERVVVDYNGLVKGGQKKTTYVSYNYSIHKC